MANERKKTTMSDLARRAGVSQSTVSRVINRRPGIDAAKVARVRKAMTELGYEVPKPDASSRIGVLFCPLPEQKELLGINFHTEMMKGIEAVAAEHAAECLPYSLELDAETPGTLKSGGEGVAGLILVGRPGRKLIAGIEADGIPYVIISGGFPPDYPIGSDVVCPDEFATAEVACDYLERNGRKRLGFLLSEIFLHRIDGFRIQLMRRRFAEIRDRDIFVAATTGVASHIDAAYRFLAAKDRPDAVVVSHYAAALALKRIFEHHGIGIPEDLLLLTYAHTAEQDQVPALLHDARTLGYKAAKRLFDKIADPADSPQKTLVEVRLINEDKCRRPSVISNARPLRPGL